MIIWSLDRRVHHQSLAVNRKNGERTIYSCEPCETAYTRIPSRTHGRGDSVLRSVQRRRCQTNICRPVPSRRKGRQETREWDRWSTSRTVKLTCAEYVEVYAGGCVLSVVETSLELTESRERAVGMLLVQNVLLGGRGLVHPPTKLRARSRKFELLAYVVRW